MFVFLLLLLNLLTIEGYTLRPKRRRCRYGREMSGAQLPSKIYSSTDREREARKETERQTGKGIERQAGKYTEVQVDRRRKVCQTRRRSVGKRGRNRARERWRGVRASKGFADNRRADKPIHGTTIPCNTKIETVHISIQYTSGSGIL